MSGQVLEFKLHDMRNFLSPKVFSISLNVICFGLTVAGLFATFFWLAVPIILVCLPAAMFAKSIRIKEASASCLFALVVVIAAFLVKQGIKF